MKTISLILALLATTACMHAQPRTSGTNPQFRRNGILYNYGSVNTWTGSGPPGTVTGSLQGDFYLDTAANQSYQCFGAGPCTAVAAGNWVQVSSSGGAFTDLTVSTLQVTSPLYNAATITGGAVIGGDIGLTGGITIGGGLTSTSNSNAMGALQLNSNSGSALHIPNGGITIDAGFSPTSINAAGAIIGSSMQTQFLQVTNTSTFGNNMTITGNLTASGSVIGAGVQSTGGITAVANIVSVTGDIRSGGNKAKLVADGSIVWANGLANLDISGNVNGVQGAFSGVLTAPQFYSTTGNFKVSTDNILFNRASSGTAQSVQFLVGNATTAAGAFSIGPDTSGSLAIKSGTGAALNSVLLFNSGGDVTMANAAYGGNQIVLTHTGSVIWANAQGILGTGGEVTGTVANFSGSVTAAGLSSTGGISSAANITASAGTVAALKFRNISMVTSCSGQVSGTFWNNSGVVNVCP